VRYVRLTDDVLLDELKKEIADASLTPIERFGFLINFLIEGPVRPLNDHRLEQWDLKELDQKLEYKPGVVKTWRAGRSAPPADDSLLHVFLGSREEWDNERSQIGKLVHDVWYAARISQPTGAPSKRAKRKSESKSSSDVGVADLLQLSWNVERAHVDVVRRVEELPGDLFGRAEELAKLDHFVEQHDRGVAIVSGVEGSGKSAFLAKWMKRREEAGDQIVRHFVSTKFSASTETFRMLQHLAMQLGEIGFVVRAKDILSRSNERQVLDDLSRLLKQVPSKRTIIVIDALDELKTPLLAETFVKETIAKNVFVVVSGRTSTVDRSASHVVSDHALPAELPLYLNPWLETERYGVPLQIIVLERLGIDGVTEWVLESGKFYQLKPFDVQRLAALLLDTTHGVPRSLAFLMSEMGEGNDGIYLLLDSLAPRSLYLVPKAPG
jgi:AAA ATPase-like protein